MRKALATIAALAFIGGLTACDATDSASGGPESPGPASAATPGSGSAEVLSDGPVAPGRYVIEPPPRFGWAECGPWIPDCPPAPPHSESLHVELDVPPGWEAGFDGTVLAPVGLDRGSTEGPDGAGLVIGWTNWAAGLHSDPCLPVSHSTPDIWPGPSVDDFVDAVVGSPPLHVSGAVAVTLGGYRGQFLHLVGPKDISQCYVWRPFEPGIFAQGPQNQWDIWVIDVDGLRMIVLAEQFPHTPDGIKSELRSMVESIRFLP